MEDFEKKLFEMTKPEVTNLMHQELLADAIIKTKDKSALSFWWLSVPLYIIAALLMKTLFIPGTTLISNIHELESIQKYLSLIFFLIVPVVFIVINLLSVKRIYFLSGNPDKIQFLQKVWYNVIIIIASILTLIFYFL